MSLQHISSFDLPDHLGQGGFDHAAVHPRSGRLYVAHTANDSLDVIDCTADVYLHSIPDLKAIAGALVSEERDLVFISNRGENTVGIFSPERDGQVAKIGVGIRPNGLAYDAERSILLAANVGDPAIPGSFTVSMVDVEQKRLIANIAVPGRTRWTILEGKTGQFYVNIADPAQIVVISATNPTGVERIIDVPASGPHGLDLDVVQGLLFCACDARKLVCIDAHSGDVLAQADLSGVPDVIFFNPTLKHLYVAVGDPGVIDVFDTSEMRLIESVNTERRAHTIAFNPQTDKVYAFLPQSHRAAIYVDRPTRR
jgi:DNA-binding beta-propeller fold protein YncE